MGEEAIYPPLSKVLQRRVLVFICCWKGGRAEWWVGGCVGLWVLVCERIGEVREGEM